jgi:hypothetical protein
MSSEGGPKLPRIAPAVSQSIIDELVYRFEHPLPGPGVSPEIAIARARKAVEAMRRKRREHSK